MDSKLYYECHITIEPIFDEKLDEVSEITNEFGFRVADLLMKKRMRDSPERSKFDTFCTSRSKNYEDILDRMYACVSKLTESGYKVWRYKVEDTLLDVRTK